MKMTGPQPGLVHGHGVTGVLGFRSSQSGSKKDRRKVTDHFFVSLELCFSLRGTIFLPWGFSKKPQTFMVGRDFFTPGDFPEKKGTGFMALPTTPIKTSDYPQQPPGRSEGQAGG